jgi:hypothetical protein
MTDVPPGAVPDTTISGKVSRRSGPRVKGPFDGRRLGLLELPLRIHDLSVGGCLIESYHEVAVGRRFQLEVELPGEGWVRVEAETLYLRENFGFAAKFVGMHAEARVKLARAVLRLVREQRQTGQGI